MLARWIALAVAISIAPAASAVPVPGTSPASVHLPAAARGAAATVDAFHRALRRGDTRAALRLLSDDALIFESGGVERGKAEYAAHHLGADAEFSRAVPSVLTRRTGGMLGGLAWIASEGRTTGSFRGKAVDRKTTETMLLRRVGGVWKIAHIHWSSAAAPSSAPATSEPLLTRSSPANGATVNGPVHNVELHFARPVRLMEVTVSGPDGLSPMMVNSAGEQAHYSLPLHAVRPGPYAVDWRARVGAREDRGSFSFTVR